MQWSTIYHKKILLNYAIMCHVDRHFNGKIENRCV